MDTVRFDALSRALATGRSRRGLTWLLGGLALGAPLSFLAPADAPARKKHKKKKKKKKNPTCQAESKAQTCDGKCAKVTNNCGATVDCGDCACGTGCPICQTCDGGTGQCIPDPQQRDDTCGQCRACDADGQCSGVPQGTPCDAGDDCTVRAECWAGLCTTVEKVADGTACGQHAEGGTTRCCGGTCLDRSCTSANLPCDDEDNCTAVCCSGAGYFQNDAWFCKSSEPGAGACVSDFDCPFQFVQCQCGRCCIESGKPSAGQCVPEFCCSGSCLDATTCN